MRHCHWRTVLVILLLAAPLTAHAQGGREGFLSGQASPARWWEIQRKQFEKNLKAFTRDATQKPNPVARNFSAEPAEIKKLAKKETCLIDEFSCWCYVAILTQQVNNLYEQASKPEDKAFYGAIKNQIAQSYPVVGDLKTKHTHFLETFKRVVAERAKDADGNSLEQKITDFLNARDQSVYVRIIELRMEAEQRSKAAVARVQTEKKQLADKHSGAPTPQQRNLAMNVLMLMKFFMKENKDFLQTHKLSSELSKRLDKDPDAVVEELKRTLIDMGPVAVPAVEEALDEFIQDSQMPFDLFEELRDKPCLVIRYNIADPDGALFRKIGVVKNYRAHLEEILGSIEAQYKPAR